MAWSSEAYSKAELCFHRFKQHWYGDGLCHIWRLDNTPLPSDAKRSWKYHLRKDQLGLGETPRYRHSILHKVAANPEAVPNSEWHSLDRHTNRKSINCALRDPLCPKQRATSCQRRSATHWNFIDEHLAQYKPEVCSIWQVWERSLVPRWKLGKCRLFTEWH